MNIIQLKDYDGEYLMRHGHILRKEDVPDIPEGAVFLPAKKYVVKEKEYYTDDIDNLIEKVLRDMHYSYLPGPINVDAKFSKEKVAILKEALIDVFYDYVKANEFYYINNYVSVVKEFDFIGFLKKYIKIKEFECGKDNYFFVYHSFREIDVKKEEYTKFQGVIYFDLLDPLSKSYFLEKLNDKEITLEELNQALEQIKNENRE